MDVGICHIYMDVLSNTSVCLSLTSMGYNMDVGICDIYMDVVSNTSVFEFDQYGIQH